MTEGVHLFGVRHHGPGSARSLRRSLERLQPDAVLVEGPPDAEGVLPLLAHPEMRPPVALLVYASEAPSRAVYYPFAEFSPEYQAIRYGLSRGVPVRFMDLPQAHQLLEPEPDAQALERATLDGPEADEPAAVAADPLGWLARAAGFSDGERYWEFLVERRRDDADVFEAVLEAMAALREEAEPSAPLEPREAQREAHMRTAIRRARAEGFERVAVVCGAWHGPALAELSREDEDAAILAGLPTVKTSSTWVPWTYGRLARSSGYGAGVDSPGWYAHLWAHEEAGPSELTTRWMARVARLLRDEDLPAPSASVIEAVRLAESLAALRGSPVPGLPEMNEAARALFCWDDDLPMRLVHERLIVAETLGAVPSETPGVPLQADLEREQRRLRLKPEASARVLDLDLRNATDLERSALLHRLNLLGIPWGKAQGSGGTGTFRETWRLQWQPEFAVRLIEASAHGGRVMEAAASRARELADEAADLPRLTALLDAVLLAALPEAAAGVMDRLTSEAARATDVAHLMLALPPLARVLRYGDVRRTDTAAVARAVDGLVARVCVGLPVACSGLGDEAAGEMYDHVSRVHEAVQTLQNPEHLEAWRGALRALADGRGMHGLVAGRAARLLLELGALTADDAATRLGLAASSAAEPAEVAAWAEGFLLGRGLVLVHDDALFGVLDAWVSGLSEEAFTRVLPLLRRTFSSFEPPERRAIGEKARRGPAAPAVRGEAADIAPARGALALPLVARLLGLTGETP